MTRAWLLGSLGSLGAGVATAMLLAACGSSPDVMGGDAAGGDGSATNDGTAPGDASTTTDGTPAGDGASGADSSLPITCLGAQPGAYCGNDEVDNGDANTLYQCPGPGKAPTSSTPCANGCIVEAPGTPDQCAVPSNGDTYRLPWAPATSMQLTQDCNDSCCSDHVGNDEYAWDFANGGAFGVRAARGGTITHLKINSTTGCGTSGCANDANFIVIDHGDGTQSTYLHLQGNSLAANVACGGTVVRGQPLATSGTTGWSTGIHLHFQVSQVHPNVATCECGANGQGCAANTVPWGSFWVSSTYPSVAMQFDEWPAASQCANRRISLPASQNQ